LEFDFKFDFAPVGAPDERARVFVSMKTGAGLSGAVVRMAEPGRSGWLLVRLTCKLDRGRLAQERGNALEAIEATDWQYYEPDGKAWAPPALAGVKRAMAAVRTADRGAVAALVEAVASEDEGATPEVDDLLRGTAFLGLLSLSEAARADAVARLRAVRHRARAVRARRWAAEVCTTLEKTVAKGPPTRGAGDPAARAASALRVAENLEKSGKTAAALKQYAEVSSRFPGTPQAAAAAEHVKMLKRKAGGD
jgi:hypothetical protein